MQLFRMGPRPEIITKDYSDEIRAHIRLKV